MSTDGEIEKALRTGCAYARLSTAIDALTQLGFDLREMGRIEEREEVLKMKYHLIGMRDNLGDEILGEDDQEGRA